MIKLFSILIFLAPFCAQSAVLYTYLDTIGPNTKPYSFSYRAPDYLQLQPNTPFRISADQFASCSGGVPNYACTSATLSTSANAQAPSVSVLLVLTDLTVPANEPFRNFYYVTNFRNASLTQDGEYSGTWDVSLDLPDSFLTVKTVPDATADAPEPATAAIALTGLALLAAAKLRRTRPAN